MLYRFCAKPLKCSHVSAVNNPRHKTCKESLERTKNRAVLTLPQDTGAIGILPPESITDVRSFLTFLLLLWRTSLHQTENHTFIIPLKPLLHKRKTKTTLRTMLHFELLCFSRTVKQCNMWRLSLSTWTYLLLILQENTYINDSKGR
jgi:hypothetical protein